MGQMVEMVSLVQKYHISQEKEARRVRRNREKEKCYRLESVEGKSVVTIEKAAVRVRTDSRRRIEWHGEGLRVYGVENDFRRIAGRRGVVSNLSDSSAHRMGLAILRCREGFKSHITLTFHRGSVEEREGKRVLNAYLTENRKEIGKYVWFMEYQRRGTVHFHLLSSCVLSGERFKRAWHRLSNQLGDRCAMRYGVQITYPENGSEAAVAYAAKYAGKKYQKERPTGSRWCGRFWGCSRKLGMRVEIENQRAVRVVRNWLRKQRVGYKTGEVAVWRFGWERFQRMIMDLTKWGEVYRDENFQKCAAVVGSCGVCGRDDYRVVDKVA